MIQTNKNNLINNQSPYLNQHKDNWINDTTSYLKRIRKFLQSWAYYDFDTEVSQESKQNIESVRSALASTAGLGEEE